MFGSLASFFKKDHLAFRLVNPCEYAHCIIDVQREFCDPSYSKYGTAQTDRIARTIEKVTPAFRTTGMPTYVIYYQKWNEPPEKAFGGFHRIRPEADDIQFGKTSPSAFEYSDLAKQMRLRGVRTLLVSGFDIENCVNATVQDALREKFNVWVLSDCIGNGGPPCDKSEYIRLMASNGAEIMSVRQAISRLRAANTPRPL